MVAIGYALLHLVELPLFGIGRTWMQLIVLRCYFVHLVEVGWTWLPCLRLFIPGCIWLYLDIPSLLNTL